MIYFTSDTHFFHSNIINLSKRPFEDYKSMHSSLVYNWNKRVKKEDDIFILGDFAHKGNGKEVNELLNILNGKKYLIRGNHDGFLDDEDFDESLFEWIKYYYVLKYDKQKIVLFHFPILEWDGYFKDSIHLYGHVHNSRKSPSQYKRLQILGKRAMNVGVDVNDFSPVSIESVLKKCLLN